MAGGGAYPPATSTSPLLESLPGGEPQVSAPPPNLNYQPSLFRDASGGPKVIPIPTLTPARPASREAASTPRLAAPRPPRSISRGQSDSQQSLDFRGSDSQTAMRVEVIYCDAPVAAPLHRVIAATVDASMVLVGVALFLAVFFLSGGEIVLSKQNVPFFLGVTAVLVLFYRVLWCLAGGDTPGMRFAGLRLVDFDGRPPEREQRGLRQIAVMLSWLSAGLGLVWALVDEENLTWHDHISKTFPTPE
jgi:uncharacterized RDD family membrane protein YckC